MLEKLDAVILYLGKDQNFISLIRSVASKNNFLLKIENAKNCDDFIDIFNDVYFEHEGKLLCIFHLDNYECQNTILQFIMTEHPNCNNIVFYKTCPWKDSIELLTNKSIYGMIDSKNTHQFEKVLLNYLVSSNREIELKRRNDNLNLSIKIIQQKLSLRTTELLKKNLALQDLSITDKLTQLHNRLKLDEQFNFNLEYCKRYDADFSIILLDIDFFKKVNDTFGHQIGDQVLVTLANILKNNIRKTDIVGRWGGEEFLILCANSKIEEAFLLSDKLKNLIENENFDMVGNITASFGITCFKEKDTESTMIARADDALYSAKNKGRNRIERM